MIAKAKIVKLVNEKLNEDMFIVEIKVSSSNVIRIFVDSFNGMPIEQCVAISRHVEHSLDREEEDFELQVSSPGLTENFKVKEQYKKYTGKEIELVTNEDIKLEGLLKDSNEEQIILETSKLEKIEGYKKKQRVVKEHILKYSEIKSAKAVISFK
jgi:ribosome maturation factor RimP